MITHRHCRLSTVLVTLISIFIGVLLSPFYSSSLSKLDYICTKKMPGTALLQSHFETIQQFDSEFSTQKFTEYVSTRTGMRVIVIDQAGPKVLGYFALATEIHDDSGAPHTLEHLCFMGSKKYPYKGLLDKVATRGYSTTNAWTANDHTAYTLETAGAAAFLTVLPVYLDHVIRPTLTAAGCYTEVYHVDGEGHDAGVVYSEMQGVQNNQQSIMDLQTNRLLYEEGVGFRYETGGLMDALRVLTADRIRDFHKEMYQPKNLCLVLCGELNHEELLNVLDNFENTILDDIPKMDDPFKRPWVESKQPAALTKSTTEISIFPEEDESQGEILISYLGPSCNDTMQTTALDQLLTYLAGSSVSVLENALVEREQLASGVYVYPTPRPDTVIQFILSGVETKKLSEVASRFHELLKETASKDFNMPYMRDIIEREIRSQKYTAESSHGSFSTSAITYFLYDKHGEDSSLRDLGSLQDLEKLLKWTDAEWRAFLRRWLVENHHVTLLGTPSAEMAAKIKEEEEKRVAERQKKLGDDGLRRLQKSLDEAKAENGKEIPEEYLKEHTVHDPKVNFIETETAKAGLAKEHDSPQNEIQDIIDKDWSKLPLYIHFEHIASNFVQVSILISTQSIPVEMRPLTAIWTELFFDSPILRDGKRIEFEDVVMELERETVSYRANRATTLGAGEMFEITVRAEREKYGTVIKWIRTLMWDIIFDAERIESAIVKYLADIPDQKRSGDEMASAMATMTDMAPESIERARSTLTKASYLRKLKKLLKADPEFVISQLKSIRDSICQLSNFRVLVVADVKNLERPVSAWDLLSQEPSSPGGAEPHLAAVNTRPERFSPAGKKPGLQSFIVPLAPIDSSFGYATAKGPTDPRDPLIPKISVAIAYLDAVEGPMWNAIRGTGLAYGVNFIRRLGSVSYSIYRSPDCYKAFKESKKVLEDYISGATPFSELALEGAISSIVLSMASEASTMGAAAVDAFIVQVVRDLPKDWQAQQLEKIRKVTFDEIKTVMRDVLLPIFTPETSNVFVTCAPVMQSGQLEGFKSLGFEPESRTLADFQDDYGLEAPGGDADDDDDDEDDEDDEEGEEDDDDGEDDGK